MLHEKRSILPAALLLLLLVLLIAAIPVGVSPAPVRPPVLPGLHGSLESPGIPFHVVPADPCSSTTVPSPNPSRDNVLTAVSAPTASFAWAVGYQGNGSGLNQTLTEQWNGTAWRVVNSPSPSINNFLRGVSGDAKHAWAVGYISTNTRNKTLIEEWNGSVWRVVNSPNPEPWNFLYGVVGDGSNAWAVGFTDTGGSGRHERTLIEHWNGSDWSVVNSPSPVSDSLLQAVVGNANSAWAVGYTSSSRRNKTLIEQWNGTAWRVVNSPSLGLSSILYGVAGTATSAWVVGYRQVGLALDTLIEQWNGTAWRVVSSPNPQFTPNILYGVAGTAKSAWAVGYTSNGISYQTLTEHWNGSIWRAVNSPNLSINNYMLAVAQEGESGHFWSVGYYNDYNNNNTLIVRC